MFFNSQSWLLGTVAGILSSTQLLVSAQAPALYQAPYFSVSHQLILSLAVSIMSESSTNTSCLTETRLESASLHLGGIQPRLSDSWLHACYPIHSTSELCPFRGSPEYSNSAPGSSSCPDRRLHACGFGGNPLFSGSKWTIHLRYERSKHVVIYALVVRSNASADSYL